MPDLLSHFSNGFRYLEYAGQYPSGENCEALLVSANQFAQGHQLASLLHMSVSDSDPRQLIVWPLKKDAPSSLTRGSKI